MPGRIGATAPEAGPDAILAAAMDLSVEMHSLLRRLLESGGAGAVGSEAERSVFRREDDHWLVRYEGHTVRLGDSKGMRHIGRLLGRPGHEIHTLELAAIEERAPDARPGDGGGSMFRVLGAQVQAASRCREELGDDLAEAENGHDPERASRARWEIDLVEAELAAALGLAGRDRSAGRVTERARLNVTRAIRSAIKRIATAHTELGAHLDVAVRTGLYCAYTPDPRASADWEL